MSLPSDFRDDTRTRFQKFATSVIKAGEIPKHIAFIMDGNRRFSKKNGISMAEAYQKGGEKSVDAIKCCLAIGVKEVTLYAFSIENFKRPENEKQVIFGSFKKNIENLLEDDEGDNSGFCLRVIGDWSYIPDDLQQLIAEAMVRTRHNTTMIINLAFAYTSRNEIARGSEILNRGVLGGEIEVGDITPTLLTDVLQVFSTNPVDILIRTSDTHRLSDFLLWQSTDSVLSFLKHEWPELTFWDIWIAIFNFQRRHWNSKTVTSTSISQQKSGALAEAQRRRDFLEKLQKTAWEKLEAIAQLDVSQLPRSHA